jgi:hypothetical protein
LRATGPDASLPIHLFITLTQVCSSEGLSGGIFFYPLHLNIFTEFMNFI